MYWWHPTFSCSTGDADWTCKASAVKATGCACNVVTDWVSDASLDVIFICSSCCIGSGLVGMSCVLIGL